MRGLRAQLLARIQPALERLGEELVDMLAERIEMHLHQLELAFDASASAFASDLSVTDGAARRYDVRAVGRADRVAAQPRSRRVDDPDRSGERTGPRKHVAQAGDVPDTTPTANRALQQGQDLPPSTSTPARRICGCALRGPHRKDCSLPNTSTSPAGTTDPALTPSRSPAASPISRPDRFADIEASRRRREEAARSRAERARSFVRRDGVRPTRGPGADTNPSPDAEARPLEPVATFEF